MPPNASGLSFNVNRYALFYPFDTRPELDVPNNIFINAPENPNLSQTGIAKNGGGRMRLGGNDTYAGLTSVNSGALQVDGSISQSAVAVNSGELKGAGQTGQIFLTSASAAVGPGDSPGILTCGNFDNGGGSGTLQVELDAPAAGTGYSQLNEQGGVNLNGMSLKATLGYASATNDQFTIVANDGTDPVVGTFSGLAQNGKLYVGGQLFQITYTGGTGNDVVLERLTTPPPPELTIERLPANSVALLWPTNDPPFSLQTATNLPASNWAPALPLPMVIGTNNVVTNSAGGLQQYYRLSYP
jgi:autotransporter-associated beta strand protein